MPDMPKLFQIYTSVFISEVTELSLESGLDFLSILTG